MSIYKITVTGQCFLIPNSSTTATTSSASFSSVLRRPIPLLASKKVDFVSLSSLVYPSSISYTTSTIVVLGMKRQGNDDCITIRISTHQDKHSFIFISYAYLVWYIYIKSSSLYYNNNNNNNKTASHCLSRFQEDTFKGD